MTAHPAGLAYELAPVDALPAPGDPRWRSRLTPGELAYCTGLLRAGEHLAARVLAKRAVARTLGWPDEDLPWGDIELRREVLGPPRLVLRGDIAAWREQRGLPLPAVTLSHAGGHAAAAAWLPRVR